MERGFELFELTIDGDPQRLEDARRRMSSSSRGGAMRDSGDGLGEVATGSYRLPIPPFDDVSRDPAAVRVFPIAVNDVGEFRFVDPGEQVGSRFSFTDVESQIEGAFGVETESPRLVGKLIGRVAEIEQDTIDGGNLPVGEDAGKVGIAGLDEVDVRPREVTGRNLQHHGVPVKTDQRTFGTDPAENLAAVPRGTDRAVDDRQSRRQLQRVQRFSQQDRDMDRAGRTVGRIRHGQRADL